MASERSGPHVDGAARLWYKIMFPAACLGWPKVLAGSAREQRTRFSGEHRVSISERGKEIKRRRHRRKKLAHWAKRLEKATVSERAAIADKIRSLTPGCEAIVERWSLQQR
jgi:hypothetical protein